MASDKDGTDIPVVVDDWDKLDDKDELDDENELDDEDKLDDKDELDDDNEATDEGDSHEEVVCAEKLSLWLPSRLGHAKFDDLQLQFLDSQELQLRQGQTNDVVAGLHLKLEYKALLFRS